MSYENGSCRITATYTGKNGLWEQSCTWANHDYLDDAMERVNPGRKNGRIKDVSFCVEFFYNDRDSFGPKWGPRHDQTYWYFWSRA